MLAAEKARSQLAGMIASSIICGRTCERAEREGRFGVVAIVACRGVPVGAVAPETAPSKPGSRPTSSTSRRSAASGSTTSTFSIRSSARRFIKLCTYAPVARRRSGSTAMSGPSARPSKRRARVTPRSPTALRAPLIAGAAASAVRQLSAPATCRRSSTAGSPRSQPRSALADRAAGYWWELSMRQVEVSRTLVLDDPRRARCVLRSLGRRTTSGSAAPKQVSLVFARQLRRPTRHRYQNPDLLLQAPRSGSTSATSTPASSNTSKTAARSGSRPSSTGPPTSTSQRRLHHLPELIDESPLRQPTAAYHRASRPELCHRLCAL